VVLLQESRRRLVTGKEVSSPPTRPEKHGQQLCSGALKRDAHPVHAVVVSDLQLLLRLLEAGMFVVIGWGFKVDVHIVSRHCKERVKVSGGSETRHPGLHRTGRERNLHARIINNLAGRV